MVILFDLDGTLIDSTEAILESFHEAFQTFGTAVAEDEAIKAQIGHPLDVMFKSLGVNDASINEHVSAYKMHYRKISCAKTVLLPDAKEAVELASRYATLGVVTTKTAQYSIELLEHLGLMQYFDVLIGRENVDNPKPHPEPILKALFKLQHDKKECWMIGDTPMDILAAQAAGVESVAVSCGYASKTVLLEYTNNVMETALDAVKLIAL
jgi:phosphoglycolate phosphatase